MPRHGHVRWDTYPRTAIDGVVCDESDELLRKWLNGEEAALLAWLQGSNPPTPRPLKADRSLLLAHQSRAIAERERELERERAEVEALRAELHRRLLAVPVIVPF